MAEHLELYRRATSYDIVFDRDVSCEVDFISAICEARTGRRPTSVLELACGPAYHARAFAQLGARAYGLDLRPEMVDLARERAAEQNVSLSVLVGDMRAFDLPEPVDVAFTVFDGIDCLLTNAEIVAHLRATAAILRADGVYVVDLTHPRDCSQWQYGDFRYTGERDGCRVNIDWATNHPVADPLTNVVEVEVIMRVQERGVEQVFRDSASERFLTAQELNALAELSGVLEVVGWYGDFALDQPFDNSPAARRMIAVLAKQQQDEDQEQNHREPAQRGTSFVSPSLTVGPSPKGGRGLFAQKPIAAGDVLVVWSGSIISAAQLAELTAIQRCRALQVEEGLHLIAEPEPADFVNHSCEPNAGLSGQVVLVALRAIRPGEEVCYDYAMSEGTDGDEHTFICHCGSNTCRGRITGEDWRRSDLESRYAGSFSPYLQRRIG